MLLNKYGIAQVAEKKYVKLIKNLIYYQKCSKRVFLFGTFMGIHVNYDGDLEFYLKTLYFLINKW